MQHSESTFNGAGGLTLYYQKWQPDQKARAVLAIVHGFGEHSGRYMNVVNHFVNTGFTIYSFDHRGHGRSEGQRGHIMQWAEFREDVQNFLQMVCTKEKDMPVFLMGHSMGGLIVLNYLLHNHEELTAVIASAPLLAQPRISPILVMISRILSNIWPGFSIDTKLDVNSISRDPEAVKAYQEDPLVHSTASARFGTELTAAIEWTQTHAAEFNLPLMIIHGNADSLVPPEGSRKFFDNLTINDKEIHMYEGGYHEPHNDLDKITVLNDFEQWILKHM
jgi:alpha-beta hydrolase superfamily lysophospholipase